jgi:argininosuccinate lyase
VELANFLVRERGLPFRSCHEIVGKAVLGLIERGKTFADLKECQALLREQGVEMSLKEIGRVTDPSAALLAYSSLGSSAPKEVRRMVRALRAQSARQAKKADTALKSIQEAKGRTESAVRSLIQGKGTAKELLARQR